MSYTNWQSGAHAVALIAQIFRGIRFGHEVQKVMDEHDEGLPDMDAQEMMGHLEALDLHPRLWYGGAKFLMQVIEAATDSQRLSLFMLDSALDPKQKRWGMVLGQGPGHIMYGEFTDRLPDKPVNPDLVGRIGGWCIVIEDKAPVNAKVDALFHPTEK
jgi:hypothetical protein